MSKYLRRLLFVRSAALAKGGKGSGNFHHEGRRAKRGGSEPDQGLRLIEQRLIAHALPWRHLEFSERAWKMEFPDGTVKTPIGVVKLGDRQHEKLSSLDRKHYFGLIRPTLENPAYVVSTRETDEQLAVRREIGETPQRASKLEFIRAFVREDGEHQGFLCVTVSRGAIEVSVSSGPRRLSELARKVRKGAILTFDLPYQGSPQALGAEDGFARAVSYAQFTHPLLKSNPDALALDLLAKAEQLGLFDIPVNVKPSIRKDGTVVRGHVATRRKRLAPKGKQPDLFGAAAPKDETVRLGRLGHFIDKHGGYRRLLSLLASFSPAQKDTLLASMAKLAGKSPAAILDIQDGRQA